MNIAIIGTGSVATTLGRALAAAGHAVTLGSRDPGAEAGGLPVAEHAAAIAAAEVVINTVPGAQSPSFYGALGAEALAGKILVDLSNAVTPSFELAFPNASVAEKLQETLPQTHVVKTLNTIPAELMAAPGTLPASTVFVSGDAADAKATVVRLLGDLGWPADAVLDLGGIASARGPEHYFPLFVAILQATGSRNFNLAVVR